MTLSAMLHDPEVLQAMLAGIVVAVLCACVGVFVVMRRQSFAGHAVTDLGFTGGAGAPLAGAPPLAGLIVFSVAGSLLSSTLGKLGRDRDVATGTVLSLALGLGSLFLYIQTRYVSEPASLLFGSIFAIQPSVLRMTVWIGAGCLLALGFLYRPLLYVTANPEAAAARGISVRFINGAFLVVLALAVAEAAQLVGVLLTTALLIGPAATAILLARRMSTVIFGATALGVVQIVTSITLAYASYTWPPGGKGWPVSFFVGAIALLSYAVVRGLRSR